MAGKSGADQQVEQEVLGSLNQKAQKPQEIVSSLQSKGFSAESSTEAIWRLIDRNEVELTSARLLQPAKPTPQPQAQVKHGTRSAAKG